MLPDLGASKAIHRLSGDQRGLPGSPKEVNCASSRPLLSQVQSSTVPERAEENTIFFPSGEYCGSASRSVDAIHFCGWTRARFDLGPGMRQMLESATISRMPADSRGGKSRVTFRSHLRHQRFRFPAASWDHPQRTVPDTKREHETPAFRCPVQAYDVTRPGGDVAGRYQRAGHRHEW